MRRPIPLIVGGLLVLAPFLTAGTPLAASETTPAGPLVVIGEERWENVNRTIDRIVVVPQGASLTVEDSRLDLRIPERCTPGRINGLYCQPHVQVQPGGELVIQNSTILSTFDDHADWPFLSATGGELTVEDSTVRRLTAINAQFDGHLSFTGNDVDEVLGEIGVWRGATGVISHNHFSNTTGGVSAQDASPEISNNTFEEVPGFSIRAQQSIVGDKAYVTAPRIVDNVFVNPDQGIFTDSGGGLEIAHNRFVDARFHAINVRVPTQDFMTQSQPLSIQDNVFTGNHRELSIHTVPRDTSSVELTVEMHGNQIEQTVCEHVEADDHSSATLTVDARHNWWGSPGGPSDPLPDDDACEAFDGNADVQHDPWLDQRPSSAGPR